MSRREMLQPFTADEAMAKAVEIAGSSDFGPSGFREGLERALAAFDRLPLTSKGRASALQKVVEDLTTRLRIEKWYKTYPEIQPHSVEGPVFVVGLPRTGTTATVAMLALDERFRFLRHWEGNNPVPPPIAGEEDRDSRLIAGRAAAKTYDKAHMHLFNPDGPEEDLALLSGLDMHSYYGAYPMPEDYLDWWLAESFDSTYAYLERVLTLLHSRRPPHFWLLKSPPHLFRLDVIARRFPNAKFVMTHRDPIKVLGSVASLHFTLYNERCISGAIKKEAVGPPLLRFWTEGMRRALSARAALGEHRFIDVLNSDVVERPLEVFERIYSHLCMNLTAELKASLVTYHKRNAPGSFGIHHYTLEEFGLTDASIRQAFREYMVKFSL